MRVRADRPVVPHSWSSYRVANLLGLCCSRKVERRAARAYALAAMSVRSARRWQRLRRWEVTGTSESANRFTGLK